MKFMAGFLGVVLLSTMAGCLGGPRMQEIELTPTQQLFKTKTTFEKGVVGIEVRRQDGTTRTLDTARNYEAEWGLLLPPPLLPGLDSREWLLSKNAHDGKTLLYTVVSWDDDNPADYLAAGWWLHLPPGVSFRQLEEAERGVFIDGPAFDLSNPPEMPAGGQATYVGTTGGIYRYEYGSGWGELEGESQFIEFGAELELTADFTNQTIEGCIACGEDKNIELRYGTHLYPVVTWRTPDPAALPSDYELRLGATSFNPDGTFESDANITVEHPERTVTQTTGLWAGQFSNIPDRDGNPRRIVGYGDIGFDEADGSHGSFMSIFSALTPATLGLDAGEAP